MLDPMQLLKKPLITIQTDTDTATPRSVVPVYFVHSLDEPFCSKPFCECHAHQEQVMMLLFAIDNAHIRLDRASSFSLEKK